jgi:predicted transcriptional regulator
MVVDSLHSQGKSLREIASQTGVSKSTIHTYLKSIPSETTVAENDVPKLIISDIQGDSMISHQEADTFVNELVSSVQVPTIPATKTSKKATKTAEDFMENLLSSKTKGKTRVSKQVVPKQYEDPQIKGELIARLTMNVNNFEPLLTDFLKPSKDVFLTSLQKKNCSELEVLLKTMETTRSVANLTNQFMHFFYLGTNVVEVGTTHYLGMDTQGFSMALRQQNDEIRMIMKEMCMNKVESFKKVTTPEIRLAMIMTTTLIGVNAQNSMRKKQKVDVPKQKKETPEPKNEILSTPSGQPPKPKIVSIIPDDTVSTFSDL